MRQDPMEQVVNKIVKLLFVVTLIFEYLCAPSNAQVDLKPQVIKFIVLRSNFKKTLYTKFRLTYTRIVVCGLSRSQKLRLCSHILQNEPFEYEFDNKIHPDLSCQQLPVPAVASRKATVPVFRCPTPHLKLGQRRAAIHVPISYYLSSALDPLTIIMYYRFVGLRVGIIPFASLERSSMPNLAAIAKTDRMQAYKRDFSETQFFYHDVAPYYIQKKTPSMVRAPAYAETQLSNFIQHVIHNNLTYSKFQMAFNSMNICKLVERDRIHVCGKAFNGNEHGYNSARYVPLKCEKVLVSFQHKPLRSSWLHFIFCGSTLVFENNVKSFYVSSSIQKNSVLTHVRYDPHLEVLPEAMILNVNSEKIEATSRDFVRLTLGSNKRKLSSTAAVPRGPLPKRIKP